MKDTVRAHQQIAELRRIAAKASREADRLQQEICEHVWSLGYSAHNSSYDLCHYCGLTRDSE